MFLHVFAGGADIAVTSTTSEISLTQNESARFFSTKNNIKNDYD